MAANRLSNVRTSTTDSWSTPQAFFDAVNAVFHFTVDACADKRNRKCKKYFDEKKDGLKQDWTGEVVWVNPPYSQNKKWLEKIAMEATKGTTIAALIPSRTDTRYWHDYATKAHAILFVKGRLKFSNPESEQNYPAKFPSALLIFNPGKRDLRSLTKLGHLVILKKG